MNDSRHASESRLRHLHGGLHRAGVGDIGGNVFGLYPAAGKIMQVAGQLRVFFRPGPPQDHQARPGFAGHGGNAFGHDSLAAAAGQNHVVLSHGDARSAASGQKFESRLPALPGGIVAHVKVRFRGS